MKKVQDKIKINKEKFQGYGTAKKNRENTVEINESKANYKILFWNIAGMNNKDKEFWEYLIGFEIIVLSETWIEGKEWKNLKSKLPKEYKWKCEEAKRNNKKGRAKGGIITGVRKEIEEVEEKGVKERVGVQQRIVKLGTKEWKIMGIYSREIKETIKNIEELVKPTEESNLLLGGDFNARIGKQGGRKDDFEEEKSLVKRETKDIGENKQGNELIKMIEENGWSVLNGNMRGDEKGEYTYVGARGKTVIDYGIVNEEAWKEIKTFKIGERIDSDHQPLEVEVEGTYYLRRKDSQIKKKIKITMWSEKNIEMYKKNLENMRFKETTVDGKIEELIRTLDGASIKKEINIPDNSHEFKNRWWDKDCRRMKRETRQELRKWKQQKTTKEQYTKSLKLYKQKCAEKKRKWKEDEEKKIKSIKSQEEVWKYINQGRLKKLKIDERIKMSEWRDHFMELLEGKQEEENNQNKARTEEKKENEIKIEEVENVIARLKKKKATGEDGIQNEVWMYATEEVRERLREIMNDVWMGKGFPERWREGLVCPIHKKGETDQVKNYRGITILDTAYKIYAMILDERLRRELEEKEVLPDGQAGFRKERGTMDNVYILKHLIDQELEKKAGKLYALFIDLKAAFDSVDRVKMWECLRAKDINEHLVRRMEEIYEKTLNRVKVGDEKSESFLTKKGVRQGCPLSPSLFAAYIGDMEEMFRKAQSGGVVVGKEKVWSLAYADDIVLVAKEANGMKEMMKNLERYIRRKMLSVNVLKTKMMVFKKGGGKRKQEVWKWEGQRVESVNEFKYLGYVFNERNNEKAHVRELARKANKTICQVWGIGQRIFDSDFKKRVMMFDSLVKSSMLYGSEVWGWKEQECLEAIQTKYMKWVLRLERETPWYIVLEECKRDLLRVDAGKRAVKYEEKIRERPQNKILYEC